MCIWYHLIPVEIEMESYVTQAGFEISMLLKTILNSWLSCPHLPGITTLQP